MADPLALPIVISDGARAFIREDIQALEGLPAVDIPDDRAQLILRRMDQFQRLRWVIQSS